VGAALFGLGHLTGARAASCTPNADGHGDSAVVINPSGTFSGTVDATGCDFGIYVGPGHKATIKGATVFGATYSDIAVDGKATITNSELTQSDMDIEVGVYYPASAVITGNTLQYLDDGCGIGAYEGGATVVIHGNKIIGPSATVSNPYGMDLEDMKSATVTNNDLLTNNIGIYLSGTGKYRLSGNVFQTNQIGIEADQTTNAQIVKNTLNVGQTGILDEGTGDTIQGNLICNYATPIDTTGATNPHVSGNRIC
jgi:parallel beta-helix repeat protein